MSIDVPPKLAERARLALDDADEAFWTAVAAAFPEVKTGDFSPEATLAWDAAKGAALSSWLHGNHPDCDPWP